ncbi:dual specificity protein phosphatase [Propionicimonas sp.]|uniref:protein-tyrosine phosphatase family protein n=1 Tax=Propionicimonas sp. TaxID=1955623 RepID=UPI001E0B63B7|nr:dual specificity protein phosphatase [Propionicimonas sp.]MBU3976737.1 dual specificity protein phosphatase family protein [Actinomycetota bacterium]MBU3986832.1 dual specificity protein phosphatase family protein [Actinomycetota bacterium]MBU4006744.1 dual specificity protein phosphatase family protein [Actinomycetota bacterium]MBU4065444.1 dual specificity protein phosphatase family protein [Actinomycetota bacterium]MBU4092500.1 dual specificity protein phosphatase family protein [Actinom
MGDGSGQEAAAVLPELAVANAVFLTERIALGGDLSPNFRVAKQQLDELVEAGITHVADLRSEWSDEVLVRGWAPQVNYLHHRVEDAGQLIDPQWFEQLVTWVHDALEADLSAKVLVHCHMGVNRAPSAALAVLLDQGMGLRDALDRIRAARPVAVIDYAGSVLSWYLTRTGADTRTRHNLRRALVRWRQSHDLDVEDVIRSIRSQESPNSRWAVRLGPKDPETLGRVLADSGEVAVGLTIDYEPEDLGQLDEVLFLTEAGLNGRALVVGPAQQMENSSWVLPVMITELFLAVAVPLPRAVRDWFAERGPNPLLLSREDYRVLTTRIAGEDPDD